MECNAQCNGMQCTKEWNAKHDGMQCNAQWNGLKYTMAWNATHDGMHGGQMEADD